MKALRANLDSAQNEVRILRDREGQWDKSKIQLESKIRDDDGEAQRIKVLMSTFENEKQVCIITIACRCSYFRREILRIAYWLT